MEIIKKIYKILISKKIFSDPEKKELLIYDESVYRHGYESFFDEDSCFVFETRYKRLYILLYIKAILKKILFFSKEHIFQLYTIEIIKIVNPKYIISFSHYHLIFWDLKRYFKNIIFIICQHHISLGYDGKHELNPIAAAKKRYKEKKKIDHIFLWGKTMIDGFKECLEGNFYQSGSIKNNIYKNIKSENKKDLLYMSQYQVVGDTKMPIENGTFISRYKYFNARKKVLDILYEYCLDKKLNLVIAPRAFIKEKLEEEKKHYEKILDKKNFNFLNRSRRFQTYEEVFSNYKYFVVIDCSTGYEAMARGKRVAHLNVVYDLNKISGGKNNRFGWPGDFKLKGPFWTNTATKSEIFRCLDFIFQTDDESWKEIKKNYVDPIILYDEENKIFKGHLKKIGLKLK